VKSEIVVPMFDGNDVIGVLDIDSDELDAFNEDDRRFLEALTKRATPFVRVAQEST